MIVTCPACSVRYSVDGDALGTNGRKVRCARCGHTWHQAPAQEKPVSLAVPPPEPLREPPPAPPRIRPRPLLAITPDESSIIRAALGGDRGIEPRARATRRRTGKVLAWTLGTLVVLLALAAGALFGRDQIIATVPAAAGLYARAGLAPAAHGPGLAIRNVATSRDMENGLPALVVTGEVANESNVPRDVPGLVVTLRDSGEHDLATQPVSLGPHRLAPGETLPFKTSILQPAEATAGVVVTFAGGNPG